MAISNIDVSLGTPPQILVTWDSSVLVADVDTVKVSYGQDSEYGNEAFGSVIEDLGASGIRCRVAVDPTTPDPDLTEPWHFQCYTSGFSAGVQTSSDQQYPAVSVPALESRRRSSTGGSTPGGGF